MDIYVCFALLKAKVDEELDAIIYDLSLSDTQEIDKQGNMRPFVLESDLLDERYHVPTDCWINIRPIVAIIENFIKVRYFSKTCLLYLGRI